MITKQLFLDKAQWIMGWMSMEELSLLAEISNELKDNSIIYEIGSFCGRSARVLADNAPNDCKIYCIDPWEFKIPTVDGKSILIDKTTYNHFCFNLNDHITSTKIIPIISKWEDYTPLEKADFIFIDGNHTYEATKCDILKALTYINHDGIIAGHDYDTFESVNRAVNEFFLGNIRVKDTIWYTKKF